MDLSPSSRPPSRNPVDERIGLFATVDSSRFAPCALPEAFLEPGGASSIPPVIKQNHLQRAVFFLRRSSLALIISLMSAAGRISHNAPYFRTGCCDMS